MNNNEKQGGVMHRPETLMRMRQVEEWLISGTPSYALGQEGMRLTLNLSDDLKTGKPEKKQRV